MPSGMRFEIHPASHNGRQGWRVHFVNHNNGEIVLWSQVYADYGSALGAASLTKINAADAPIIPPHELKKAS